MLKPTEDELLIINTIIYTDIFSNDDTMINKSVYDWACMFDIESISNKIPPAETTKEQFKYFIDTIKLNKDVYSQMIYLDIDNSIKASNYANLKVVNYTIKYNDCLIIGYKGTAGPLEWADNAVAAYYTTTISPSQINSLEYFDKMYLKYHEQVNEIYVTGHSKGGNKAMFVTLMTKYYDKITKTVSFDGQGFNQTFMTKYCNRIIERSSKIYALSNEMDVVNINQFLPTKNVIYVKSSLSFKNNTFSLEPQYLFDAINTLRGFHSPYTMMKHTDKGLVLNEATRQNLMNQTIEHYLDYFALHCTTDDWNFLVYTMMNRMVGRESITFGGVYNKMPEGFLKRFNTLKANFELRDNKSIQYMDHFINYTILSPQ